ncbi:serine/threonine-protein kinase [Nocardia sp. NPDC052112]|uniref:serine/threonine-protein kinase n=1 Tax=Nocardia sp. NPDC052112 TaxID=3155646 RepID=UPI00344613B0
MVHPGIGSTFADYLIDGVLGQGGMGTVYLARHPRLPRSVALKLLNREVSGVPELRRRFEREAGIVARLEHPNIVGIYDRGNNDGYLWVAMQYIQGGDVGAFDARSMTRDRAVRIVTDTAAALDYAHAHGVLHRDIKPANILLAAPDAGREERAVLTDFGIARLLDAATKLTETGTFTATLAFAAPEQLTGQPLDHRADQYSLACTLFALLVGRSPFAADNPGQVVAGHLGAPVPALAPLRPDLPVQLDAVLARAMAKDREQRFDSCGEFASTVRAAVSGKPAAISLSSKTIVYPDFSQPEPDRRPVLRQSRPPWPDREMAAWSMTPPRHGRGRIIAVAAAVLAVLLMIGAGVTYAIRTGHTNAVAESIEPPPGTGTTPNPGGWSDGERAIIQAFPKVFSDPDNRRDWRGTACTPVAGSEHPVGKAGITCAGDAFTLSVYDFGDASGAADYLYARPFGVNWHQANTLHRGFASFLPIWVTPDSEFTHSGNKFLWSGFGTDAKFGRYGVLVEMDAQDWYQLIDTWDDVPLMVR